MVYVVFQDNARPEPVIWGPYLSAQVAGDRLCVGDDKGFTPFELAAREPDGKWRIHDGMGEATPAYESFVIASTVKPWRPDAE